MGWPDSEPEAGDFEELAQTAHRLIREAEDLVAPITILAQVIVHSAIVWTGPGSEHWRARIAAQQHALVARAEREREAGEALRTCARALEDIVWEARMLKLRRDSALEDYRAALRVMQSRGECLYMPNTPATGPGPMLAGRAEYAAADRELERVAKHRHEVEATCENRIHDLLPDSWAALGRVGSIAGVAPSTLTPAALTAALGYCSEPQIREYLDSLTDAEVATLWPQLPEDLVQRLLHASPQFVGNLNGVPFRVRDEANVLALTRDHEALTDRLAELDRLITTTPAGASITPETPDQIRLIEERNALRERLADLDELWTLFQEGDGRTVKPPRRLIAYEPQAEGPPLVSIALGDLDNAHNISTFIPGMNSSAAHPGGYLQGVKNIIGLDHDQAAVLFLGYRSPDLISVSGEGLAREGAPRFNRLLAGIAAVREGEDTRLNVIGHSYGTTMLAYALSRNRVPISSVTFLGSAGIPPQFRGNSLRVPPSRIFVTEAHGDVLADTGRTLSMRWNPEHPDFGVTIFGSDGTTLPDGTVLLPVTDHHAEVRGDGKYSGAYLDRDTEVIRNIKKIIAGRFDDLTPGDDSDATGIRLGPWVWNTDSPGEESDEDSEDG